MTEKRAATCMLCEATCGLELTIDGDRLVRVDGDRNDAFSKGYICPKAAALDDVRNDPDRVTTPLARTKGGTFAPVSWDEALSMSAERIGAVLDAGGPHALGTYVGNPLAHSYAGILGSIFLQQALGSRSRFSATSADQLPQMLASLEMFGHQALMPVPDLDRTRLLLVIGANPVVSNGSIMTAPGVKKRLLAIMARGGRVVVLDPRRTETAEMASEHLFVRPGSDAYLLAAMLQVIFEEKLERPGRLAEFTRGMGDLRAAVRDLTPELAAPLTGVPAEDVRRLAREYAGAKGAACYTRVGACTQEFGGLVAWLSIALDVVTGNLDAPGGKMFTTPGVDVVALANVVAMRGSFARFRSRVRGLPEFGGELPVAALAEEIETPGPKQIRAMLTVAGNPVLSAPNGPAVDRALGKLDFMVSIDLYRNETTRHASVILPPTFGLERDHYDMVLYAFAVRNHARYAKSVFPRRGDTRDDFDITTELALRVVSRKATPALLAKRAFLLGVRALGPKRLLDGLLRAGPHGLSLAKLERAPHGIDLGPLEPRLPRLLGKTRTVNVAPKLFVADLERLRDKARTRAPAKDELLLIGRRHLRSNNSWMHNSERLTKGPRSCTLSMHPDDAKARGLSEGELVTVSSRTGSVTLPVELTADLARGVVCMPHGWGHDRPGVELRVAKGHAGVSVNDLTDETFLDALTGNAGFSGVSVAVRSAAGVRAKEHAAE